MEKKHLQLGLSVSLQTIYQSTWNTVSSSLNQATAWPQFLKSDFLFSIHLVHWIRKWIPGSQTYNGWDSLASLFFFFLIWVVSTLLFWADDVLWLWQKLGQIQLFHRWRSLNYLSEAHEFGSGKWQDWGRLICVPLLEQLDLSRSWAFLTQDWVWQGPQGLALGVV
jgi:hypothetical protein